MPRAQIFTLGYEGLSLVQFIEGLAKAGVTMVVDVRELPLSHKPGFSKRPLSEGLARAGIDYRHMKALGAPKPIRDRLRKAGDRSAFFKEFRAHLRGQREALAELGEIVAGTSACLVCFEADPALCHRTVVAEAVAKKTGAAIRHLRS
jgi:uncharacterized protein (DUF488 family)